MIRVKPLGAMLPVFRLIPCTNRTTLQRFAAFGKCMRLEIINHLKLMFDIT